MASMYGKNNPGRHYCRDGCCFMDIYISRQSFLLCIT